MKKYLLIENEGLLELGALSLMGASTKKGDYSKIGMFGSGNKYALAFFLRNNIEVKVMIGREQVKIETRTETFRGEEFHVVWINGEKTSITTSMGEDWTLWQAIREIYSNAVDEGLLQFEMVNLDAQFSEDPRCDETTRIMIEATPEVEQFMFNLKDYLAIGKEVIFENEKGKIYRKHGSKACIYRKGIRCFETSAASIYDYDFNDISINENRLVRYHWDVPGKMFELLYACDDVSIVRNVIYNMSNGKEYLEHRVDDSIVSIWGEMSDTWAEAIEEKNICPKNMGGYVKDEDRAKTLFLPGKLYNDLVGKTGAKHQPDNFKITGRGHVYEIVEEIPDLKAYMLEEVMKFLKECKFDIPYIITVVDFKDADIHGAIGEEEILLSIKAFDHGKDWILNTILEEFIHLKHNAPDETRKFQDAALSEFITYMKAINAYSL